MVLRDIKWLYEPLHRRVLRLCRPRGSALEHFCRTTKLQGLNADDFETRQVCV